VRGTAQGRFYTLIPLESLLIHYSIESLLVEDNITDRSTDTI